MNEIIIPLIFAALGFAAGHFHGYGKAMRYCTKRLEELRP